MVLGAALLAIGLFLSLGGKLFGLGRLPGDIVVRRGNFTLYIPLTSCVLLSLVLTLVLRILRR
jgi:hypothetical protein